MSHNSDSKANIRLHPDYPLGAIVDIDTGVVYGQASYEFWLAWNNRKPGAKWVEQHRFGFRCKVHLVL